MATDTSDTSTGKTPFIDANTAYDAFTQSNIWLHPYFDPIDELYRIARARPKSGIPDYLPKLVDGTTAAITDEHPKNTIQQLATGVVGSKEYPEWATIADVMNTRYLLPHYKFMGSALQKDWNMLKGALICGRQASYTFFTQENGQFYTDFSLPYIKDVITEKGKVFGPDSNYIFMRAWYSKSDLKAIIARKDSGWDYKLLADMVDSDSDSNKPADLMTPAEKERGGTSSGGYEIIHAFQKGIGATFYSFSPKYKEGKILRTKVNKDPRGKIPIDFEYCDIDLSNPLGRGKVELVASLQNLLDQRMQMYSYYSTLMLAPPIVTSGSVNKSSIRWRPNAIFDKGNNANNTIEAFPMNSQAISNYTADQQFIQSKIYAIFAAQDNSIPSSAGNVGQSKTDAGVNATNARLGVNANYSLKMHEAWKEAQTETSLNTYFSERTTKQELQLDGEDLKKVQESKAAQYLNNEGVLTIPFDKIKDVSLNFIVDASSSEVKEDQDNAQKLTEVAQAIQQSQDPQLLQELPKIYKLIIGEIGAEGTDDIFKQETDENGQPIQQAPQGPDPAMIQQMVGEAVQQAMEAQKQQQKTISESIKWTPQDLTPAERAQALEQGGITPDESGEVTPNEVDQAHSQAMDMEQTGYTHAMALQNAAQSQAQAQDSQQQAQQQFDATQQQQRESQIMQMLQQKEQAKSQGGQTAGTSAK